MNELEKRIENIESYSELYAVLKSIPLNNELSKNDKIKYSNLIRQRLDYLKREKYR